MSTKLNAGKIARDRDPQWMTGFEELAYAAAIREVAQPIADQRDELLDALVGLVARCESMGWETSKARAAITKCTPKE